MNKIFKIIVVIVLNAVVFGCEKDEGVHNDKDTSLVYIIDCMNMPRPEGSYDYPVRPGSDKWKSFMSLEEKEKACQVPVKVLKKQSTQAVIQALWEYPMVINFMAWENKQKGFEFVFYPLNAYQELKKRPDAGRGLLDRYLLLEAIHAYYPANYILETFLAQPEFLEQLTLEDKKEAVKRGLEICEIRFSDPEYADLYMTLYTIYFWGRMMKSASYNPFTEILDSNTDWSTFFNNYRINPGFLTNPEELLEFEEQIFILAANFSGYQN